MTDFELLAILPQDCVSTQKLADFLNDQELTQDRELLDVFIWEGPTSKGNIFKYRISGKANLLSRIEVFPVPKANSELTLRESLVGRTGIAYAAILINTGEQDVLVTRRGASMQLVGKMSTFGGPNDPGVGSTEGLALVNERNFASFKDFFLPGATKPLCRMLNPDKSYIACRWKYGVTSVSWLLQHPVLVQNATTGASELAQPIDAGPAPWTGRVADLSNGLAKRLGLKTDDECVVTIPVPGGQIAPSPQNLVKGGVFVDRLVSVAFKEYDNYGRLTADHSPLKERVQQYWGDIGYGPDYSASAAWSAVFISWCMLNAGATKDEFLFSPSHSVYVQRAMQNTSQGTGVFLARKIDEYSPKIGDLIHNSRDSSVLTYDQARAKPGVYLSHSALVVDFGENNKGPYALTVGGNESDSVSEKHILLDPDGRVLQRQPQPFICIVENRKKT